MHESIDNKIIELKEICLQIMNLIKSDSYAYSYLEACTNGKVEEATKYYGESIAKAYDVQIAYILSNLGTWRHPDAKHYKQLLRIYQSYFMKKCNTGKLSETVNPLWQLIRGIGD